MLSRTAGSFSTSMTRSGRSVEIMHARSYMVGAKLIPAWSARKPPRKIRDQI